MPKIVKKPDANTGRSSRTAAYAVAAPAVKPKKFTVAQIRAAVRKVTSERQGKA